MDATARAVRSVRAAQGVRDSRPRPRSWWRVRQTRGCHAAYCGRAPVRRYGFTNAPASGSSGLTTVHRAGRRRYWPRSVLSHQRVAVPTVGSDTFRTLGLPRADARAAPRAGSDEPPRLPQRRRCLGVEVGGDVIRHTDAERDGHTFIRLMMMGLGRRLPTSAGPRGDLPSARHDLTATPRPAHGRALPRWPRRGRNTDRIARTRHGDSRLASTGARGAERRRCCGTS